MAVPHGIDRSGAAGGSGSSTILNALDELADPGVDSLIYWDNSESAFDWYTIDSAAFRTAAGFNASSAAVEIGFIQSGSGAIASDVQTELRQRFSVTQFGATGDGVTDDTAAIAAAIAAASNGATILFPAGTYLVSEDGSNGAAIHLSSLSNVHLVGDGENTTIIKLADSGDAHVVNITGCTNCSISGMTIDGNRANQTAGVHGLRVDGTRIRVSDLYVLNAKSYGIGIAQTSGIYDAKFENITVEGSGLDGIDFKNPNDDNYGVSMNNIFIDSPNRSSTTGQVGLDIRGEGVRVSNVHVRGLDATFGVGGRSGIRFREGELLGASGLGGHKSSVTGFTVIGDGSTAIAGVLINARYCQLSNGAVEGCGTGVQVLEHSAMISNVTVKDCTVAGFDLTEDGTLDADDCSLIGCVADTCVIGFDFEPVVRSSLTNCVGRDNTTADVRIEANATDITLIGNKFYSTTTVTDGGTDTHARMNHGWVTENYVRGSNAFDLASNGSHTESIAHGLDVTPALRQCQVTLEYSDTGNDDVDMGYMPTVHAVSGTTVDVKMQINTGDSGAATGHFLLYVNARP